MKTAKDIAYYAYVEALKYKKDGMTFSPDFDETLAKFELYWSQTYGGRLVNFDHSVFIDGKRYIQAE